ncbi:MAG TPA: VCBS repeat-containing protein [Gemmataceae bacterium]|nr:VCBS repeat-containing protein [Gemmataceae bacterium]
MWFSSWLRNLRSTGRGNRTSVHTFRPRLESLEGRDLPSFAVPVAYPSSQALAVVTADVNGDGRPDLITLAGNGNAVTVQLNNKKGGFGTVNGFFVHGTGSASALAVGDVNGDGRPDIVFAFTNYPSGGSVSGTYVGGVGVLLGDGKGSFTYAPTSAIFQGTPTISSLALADVYGDGKMDLVAVNATGLVDLYVARPAAGGMFQHAQASPVFLGTSSVRAQLAVGDLNGDGRPDAIVTDPSGSSVHVLLNSGTGFAPAQTFAVGSTPTSLAVGDVSGDGKLDIVTANTNRTVSVLFGQGNGSFGAAQSYAIGGPANSVALGDFNHDGRLDIATTGSAETDVLLNGGNGIFGAYQNVGPAGNSLVAADLNRDSYTDLAEVVAASSSIDVLLNLANW